MAEARAVALFIGLMLLMTGATGLLHLAHAARELLDQRTWPGVRGMAAPLGGRQNVALLLCALVGAVVTMLALGTLDLLSVGRESSTDALWISCTLAMAVFAAARLGWLGYTRFRARVSCTACGHPHTGRLHACTRCGTSAGRGAHHAPIRRVAVAGGLLLISPVPAMVPLLNEHGAASLVPTTILIAGIDLLPERLIIAGPARGSLEQRMHQNELAPWQEQWLLDRLARRLGDAEEDPGAAIRALRLGGESLARRAPEPAVSAMIDLVCHESPEVQQRIARWHALIPALESLDSASVQVRARSHELRAQLIHADRRVVIASAALLLHSPDHLGEAVAAAGACASADRQTRMHAALVLRSALGRPEGARRVMDLLRAPDLQTARLAMMALRSDPRATTGGVLDALVQLLGDPDPRAASLAAEIVMYRHPRGIVLVLEAAAPRDVRGAAILLRVLRSDLEFLKSRRAQLESAAASSDFRTSMAASELLEALDRPRPAAPVVAAPVPTPAPGSPRTATSEGEGAGGAEPVGKLPSSVDDRR